METIWESKAQLTEWRQSSRRSNHIRAGSRKELGAVVLANNLHQLVEPNHGNGFTERMNGRWRPKWAECRPQDIGRDGLIILNDVDHLLDRRLGSSISCRTLGITAGRGQLNGRIQDAIYRFTALFPHLQSFTHTLQSRLPNGSNGSRCRQYLPHV